MIDSLILLFNINQCHGRQDGSAKIWLNIDKLIAWFKSIDDFYDSEGREDRYVFALNSEDIGIKLHQANNESEKSPKLEIKWRKFAGKDFKTLDGRLAGIIEEWIKWCWQG